MEYGQISSTDRVDVLNAYAELIRSLMDSGHRGYLVTFMFQHMQGSPRSVKHRMMQDVEHFYKTLLKWVVRKPRTASIEMLPKLIAALDRPVWKRAKQRLSDVSINHGLHSHGILAIPSTSRLQQDLADHVRSEAVYTDQQYTRIRTIDVQMITSKPEYTTGYGLKGMKYDPEFFDELLILPKAKSELPPKQRRPPHQPGEMR